MKKIAKFTFKCAEILTAFVIVSLIFGIWRLSVAPIQVNFLIPTLTESLTPKNSEYAVEIENAYLELGFEEGRFLEIRLENIGIIEGNEAVLTSIPKTVLTVSTLALLQGKIGLEKIILKRPFFQILIEDNQDRKVDFLGVLGGLFDKITYLEEVRVSEAELIIEDVPKKANFAFPKVSFLARRKTENTLETSLEGELYLNNKFMTFALQGDFNIRQGIYDFSAEVKNLYLSYFGSLVNTLQGADVLLKGNFYGTIDFNQFFKKPRSGFQKFSFDLMSEKEGSLFLPAPISNKYDLKEVFLHGEFSKALEDLKIDKSFILLYGPKALLEVDVKGIGAFLDTKDKQQIRTLLKATLINVPTSQVPLLWPESIGTTAHQWVKRNLSRGRLTKSQFELFFKGEDLVDLNGLVNAEGVTVHYMEDMPVVEKTKAKVYLYPDKVFIEANEGHIDEAQLTYARLEFLGLKGNAEHTVMNIKAKGPVSKVLEIVDAPPLGYVSEFGIDSSKIKGKADVDLTLKFPLKENLDEKDVEVMLSSHLSDISVDKKLSILPVEKGNYTLKVTNKGLVLSGIGEVQNIPTSFKWEENFSSKSAFKSKYTASVETDISKILEIQSQDFLSGPLLFKATVENSFKNEMKLQAQLNLTKTNIDLPFISYTKKEGRPFGVDFSFKGFQSQKRKNISFKTKKALKKKGIDIEGSFPLSFSKELRVDFKKVKIGLNSFAASFEKKQGWKASVKGDFLDMSSFFHQAKKQKKKEETSSPSKESFDKEFDINLTHLKMAKEQEPLQNVKIKGHLKGNIFKKLTLSLLAKQVPVFGKIEKSGEFSLTTENFGNLLTLSGFSNRVQKGVLSVKAKQAKDGSFKGLLKIKDYELSKMSFLMQASTIIGIVDAFQNDKLSFKTARVPFQLSPDYVLKITEAVAYGNAVGFTMSGFVSSAEADLIGTIVPAYAVNSLFGKIPFVGSLFVPQKGGGLLSVSY
ncbi:MAG: DUF3971 domain-containing protein, partial [Alphaproteobacteria bacterium]|nr:DUF3971 domain-containing protein [Alphaproteobacteria bacterium]